MSDPSDELKAMERAAAELVPELAERLARHGLGEIEVRRGDLRVRVTAPTASGPTIVGVTGSGFAVAASAGRAAGVGRAVGAPDGASQDPGPAAPQRETRQGVPAPAVGYFIYADGLGPGLEVDKGARLGHVEVLGVAHDVLAPRTGTVRNLVTETGEAVEYGQVLIEMEVPA